MDLRIPGNRRIARVLGQSRTRYLERQINSISRILPHIETFEWNIGQYDESRVAWANPRRLEIIIRIGIDVGPGYSVTCRVRRRRIPAGIGSIPRTLEPRERAICETVVQRVGAIWTASRIPDEMTLSALDRTLDEFVIAENLKVHHSLELDPELLFREFRRLAAQTYETKDLAFGCIIDPSGADESRVHTRFPEDFLAKKRYRALSDGFRTSFMISGSGQLISFLHIPRFVGRLPPRVFFPEWSRDFAMLCRHGRIGFALTRQGDILVMEAGTLRFTFRSGRWQYWNHTHLVDMLKNAARVQGVRRQIIPRVVNTIYRAALDVSFRRSGGLFVILRNRRQVDQLVRAADRIGHISRESINREFDAALPDSRIQLMPRSLVVELAALDGAVVVNNHGELLAYGAVLEPRRRGRTDVEEGSRTKAAIGASNYGLAVKISADGDITVYLKGKEFIRI